MYMRTKYKLRAIGVVAGSIFAFGAFAPHEAHALDIQFTNAGSVSAEMMAGFEAAGAYFESLLTDNVTVRINVETSTSMSSGVIAQTSTARVNYGYATVTGALTANRTSAIDNSSVAHLQSGPSFAMVTNLGSPTRVLDNNGSTNNSNILMTTANAKALGLYADNPAIVDAGIKFNANFGYDFNRADGVSGNQYDFVGVAEHEIATALGFISGVDTIDFYDSIPLSTDNISVVSTLDLFRFSAASLAQGAGIIDTAAGGDPYFSVDGGVTSECAFSTGAHFGNGFQASRWAPGCGGLMAPTAGQGQLISAGQQDVDALDVVGWEITPASLTDQGPQPEGPPPADNGVTTTPTVPVPASLSMFGFGLGALSFARRRRS
jgi:hypothetical protein